LGKACCRNAFCDVRVNLGQHILLIHTKEKNKKTNQKEKNKKTNQKEKNKKTNQKKDTKDPLETKGPGPPSRPSQALVLRQNQK
jgi:hypothetical protein